MKFRKNNFRFWILDFGFKEGNQQSQIINLKSNGFTLIELSIVLIIISLVVAGVTGGKELIRQGELRAVVSEVAEYTTAINTFKLQYDSMPGDFRQAEFYWPGCDSGGVDSNCNGNGDNIIHATGEGLRAWQQLSDAEIIPEQYTGEDTVVGLTYHVTGVNVASSEIDGSAYTFYSFAPNFPENSLVLGSEFQLAGNQMYSDGAVNPIEAISIDTKMDDGNASTGVLIASENLLLPQNNDCTTGTAYNLIEKSPSCVLHFLLEQSR